MQDSRKKLSKYISLVEREVLTEVELVNETLHLIAVAEGEEEVAALEELLPKEIRESLIEKLKKLQASGFQWSPPVLGRKWSEDDLEYIQRGLRFAYSVFCESD